MGILKNLFSRNKLKKLHWYCVRQIINDKSGQRLLDRQLQVGFEYKATILDSKKVKRSIGSIKGILKRVNALNKDVNYVIEIEAYLGRFAATNDSITSSHDKRTYNDKK